MGTAKEAGKHHIHVTKRGRTVNGSPFEIDVSSNQEIKAEPVVKEELVIEEIQITKPVADIKPIIKEEDIIASKSSQVKQVESLSIKEKPTKDTNAAPADPP